MNTPPPEKIGSYPILQRIAKGGMGEVFLAKDPTCGRQIALKRIRTDLKRNATMQERFLQEARIAASLMHPSIIPIYTIHAGSDEIYYTMPYVQGETLKQIIRATAEREKKGEPPHPIGASIPALMRIFLSVCQAVAYAHSRGVLHRDLKPENVIIGPFGEVFVLDWGLAEPSGALRIEEGQALRASPLEDLTRPGKIPGTLTHLSPERALGESASETSDLYSLGVILYQLLTLELPFQRHSLAAYRKMMKHEQLQNPTEVAPYRDIPQHLAEITRRSLAFQIKERFSRVADLIQEIERYIEGLPEWIQTAELNIDRREDWEFQENVFLAKHIAITHSIETMEWVNLMLSSVGFPGNTKLEADIRLLAGGGGIGFLFSVPEAFERNGIEDGYCVWIGSEKQPSCKLFCCNVEVMHTPDPFLKEGKWQRVRIEKVDAHIRVFLDDLVILHYISHSPVLGSHIGLLLRDRHFEMKPWKIFSGSQNVMINCLSVPDAFLASKLFAKALSEYRRIGASFPGRQEGREALFRAGITVLEEAKAQKIKRERERLHHLALEEFGTLRATPGAPLEYLGKSLVYRSLGDLEEETKCLELSVRKYAKHPLLHLLIEHIAFRLHEASSRDRVAAYHFALLALRHLPHLFESQELLALLQSLKHNLEPLDFLLPIPDEAYASEQRAHLALQLAFWLCKPITLVEIIQSTSSPILISNGLFCLFKLGYLHVLQDNLSWIKQDAKESSLVEMALLLHSAPVPLALERFFEMVPLPRSATEYRCLFALTDACLEMGAAQELLVHLPRLRPMQKEKNMTLDAYLVWAYLAERRFKEAGKIFEEYPPESLVEESSPLYPLFGIYLWHTEGKTLSLSHFSGTLEGPHPRTSSLLARYLNRSLEPRRWNPFFWEKIHLYRQRLLLYTACRLPKKAQEMKTYIKKERHRVEATDS